MIKEINQLLPWIPFIPLVASLYFVFGKQTEHGQKVAFLHRTVPPLLLGIYLAFKVITPLVQTRSPIFPQLNYSGAAERQRLTEYRSTPLSSVVPNPQTAYQVLGSASWEIDLWRRIRRLAESAQASLLATEYARRGVIHSLVASVASSYLQLRGLDEQLLLSQKTLAAYAETVKLFELQHQYGVVSRMNVEQARSQYETAAAQIPSIESQIAQTENALSILLGRNPGPIERGKSILELTMPTVPSGWPGMAGTGAGLAAASRSGRDRAQSRRSCSTRIQWRTFRASPRTCSTTGRKPSPKNTAAASE